MPEALSPGLKPWLDGLRYRFMPKSAVSRYPAHAEGGEVANNPGALKAATSGGVAQSTPTGIGHRAEDYLRPAPYPGM
jgi:hypothetical protein